MSNEYRIIEPIVLSFLGQFDSQDCIIGPEDGTIEFNGKNIIFIDSGGMKHESHTTNNAIEIWLEQKLIEPI